MWCLFIQVADGDGCWCEWDDGFDDEEVGVHSNPFIDSYLLKTLSRWFAKPRFVFRSLSGLMILGQKYSKVTPCLIESS